MKLQLSKLLENFLAYILSSNQKIIYTYIKVYFTKTSLKNTNSKRNFFLESFILKFINLLVLLPLGFSSLSSEECGKLVDPENTAITLNSGWLFQKGDNPEWKELVYFDSGWMRKNFPERVKDKTTKVLGYHWYRCHINLPLRADGYSPIAINMGKLRDADEVYFNGRLIGSTGKFSPLTADTDKIRIYSIPNSLINEGDNVIAVRLYSSTNYLGISMIPEIGPETELMNRVAKSQIFMVLSGSVFIVMGLFFIMGSFVRSNNKSNLYFSLFSILLGFYTLLRTNYRYVFFDDFGNSYQFELIILCSMPVVFINFFTEFMNIKKNKFNYGYELFMLAIIVYIIFTPKTPEKWLMIIDLNAKLIVIPFIYIVYKAKGLYKENKKRLRYILFGSLGMAPTVIIDSLRALDYINLPQTVHFGFILFLISISIQLSEEMVENYKNYLKQETDLMKMERVKTKFLFNLSNEFKVYLDNARGICRELLGEINNPKEITEKLIKLESLTGLTKSIISDATRLHAIETGDYEIYTERFSLRELITETIHMIETRLNQKRKSLNLQFYTGDLEVQHNKELLFLILYHNLENIYLYTSEECEININIDVMGKNFQMTFKDNGNGIPLEELDDVLKKFVRGTKLTNKDTHGTGIGLPLVKAITETLGGIFKLSSTPSVGTTVEVTLPIFY